jgi:hypothetical protein
MKIMDRNPYPDESPRSLEDLAWPQTPYAAQRTLSAAIKEKLDQNAHDMVHNPPHYDLGGFQVIDIRDVLLDRIQKNGVLTYRQTDYWSRAWEYLTRFMEKNGVEDLKKGKFYLDRLISDLESSK